MLLRRVVLLGLALGGFACGSEAEREVVVSGPGPLVPFAEVAHLGWVASQDGVPTVSVPVRGGALIVGGGDPSARSEESASWAGQATLLHEDGMAQELPPVPIEGSLVEGRAGSAGDVAYVVGVDCSGGALDPGVDDGALRCDRSTRKLLRLDLQTLEWSSVDLPFDPVLTGGETVGQSIHVVSETTVVYESPADDLAWVSTDAGRSWEPISLPVDAEVCASGGELLAVWNRNQLVGGSGTGDEPLEPIRVDGAVIDLATGSTSGPVGVGADVEVLPGATRTACTPNAGVVVVATTARVTDPVNTGVVTSFRGARGWSPASEGTYGLARPLVLDGQAFAIEVVDSASYESSVIVIDEEANVRQAVKLDGRSLVVGLGSRHAAVIDPSNGVLVSIEL